MSKQISKLSSWRANKLARQEAQARTERVYDRVSARITACADVQFASLRLGAPITDQMLSGHSTLPLWDRPVRYNPVFRVERGSPLGSVDPRRTFDIDP
jgi:hypothetical protein